MISWIKIFVTSIMTIISVSSNAGNRIYKCIYENDNYKTIELMVKNQNINVAYIENSQSVCINSNFPSIHIKTNISHNKWLQLIFTDSKNDNLKTIIDSDDLGEAYPFYTNEEDFFDAPKWSYNFFYKPIKLWIAHTYPIFIDNNKKIITINQPIEWGFYFKHNFIQKPKMILPTLSIRYKEKSYFLVKQIIMTQFPSYSITFES